MFKLTGERSRSENHLHTKRLTNELLGDRISHKEAILLANGKYKCLVCSWRPILDDVKQLTIHRNGKIHRQEKENSSNKQLPVMKVSENSSSSVPLLSRTKEKTAKALLPGPRYNPFSTKKSERPDQRSIFQPQISRQKPLLKDEPVATVVHNTKDYVFPWMTHSQKTSKQKQKTVSKGEVQITPEEEHRIALEKYHLQLAQAGWKRNENGEFVKDESVEFDSDEELPPPPPSSGPTSTKS